MGINKKRNSWAITVMRLYVKLAGVSCVDSFYVSVTKAKVIGEEETSIKEILSHAVVVGKPVGASLSN